MKRTLPSVFLLLLGMLFSLPSAHAQFVNFEDTWQEFLSNAKTSDISKLVKPAESQTDDYLKYSLMYANKYFCAGDIANAEKWMGEIRKKGEAAYTPIAGFKTKFDDLTLKIKAFYDVDTEWRAFMNSRKADLSNPKLNIAKKVCEKGTLAKYFYMEAHNNYCAGDVAGAKGHFEGRVMKLAERTSLEIKDVEGLEDEVNMMKKLFQGLELLGPAWSTFVSSDASPGFDFDMPVMECYSIPNMKVYLLRAAVDPCKYGSEMLEKINKLKSTNTHTIPDDVKEKIKWLEGEVGGGQDDLAKLNKAWNEFVPKDKLTRAIDFPYEYPCHKDAEIKAYVMDGMTNTCEKGQEMLDNINRVKKEHNPDLDDVTVTKIKKLEARLDKMSKDMAALDAAWEDFVPDDQISGSLNIAFEYCDKAAQIKAYTIDGTVNMCEKGKQRLEDISATIAEFNPQLDDVTTGKIENLKAAVAESEQDLADLNSAWSLYVSTDKAQEWPEFPPKDTVVGGQIRLVDFYCDKIAQTKSWTIKGHLDACADGDAYLSKIDALKKKHNLKYDKELTCQVQRLRGKVYQCKYWKLVLQARKETHEERERFGPPSADLMRADLNGGGQPCETTVEYEPLGYIGVKYVIKSFLCQKVNLAKMGDPQYYKKIATWVDGQVLQKYCEADMRCKEDFVVYLEGHTDGYPFSGRKYDNPINIPAGTPYTHFVDGDTIQKTVETAITYELTGNRDLGLARAWTMKDQLDFMGVPIEIGAYEHPSKERGGEYRRVEIHLNITNLLLDFYEKRLRTLIKESGIGDRPKKCN